MPFLGGLFSGIGSIIGGSESASASKDAARQAAQASEQATQLQRDIYNQNTGNLLPFLQTGTAASNLLGQYFGIQPGGVGFDPTVAFLQPISSLPSIGAPPSPTDPSLTTSFRASPGYNYLVNQMTDAVQNSASVRSGAVSGNALKDIQSRAGSLADQDWWNFYNAMVGNYGSRYQDVANQRNFITTGLGGLAGAGQSAAVQQGGFGQNYANAAGQNIVSAGQARAAGTLGSANALSSSLNSLGNTIGQPGFLDWLTGSGSGGAGGSYAGMTPSLFDLGITGGGGDYGGVY